MTSFFGYCGEPIKRGMSLGLQLLAAWMHAAAPSVSAEAAPALMQQPSDFRRLAMYAPALSCNSLRRTQRLAASATASCTDSGIHAELSSVYVPAALRNVPTPSLSK